MKKTPSAILSERLTHWIQETKSIVSAVHFGSSAPNHDSAVGFDDWSDLDLHIVTTDAEQLQKILWADEFPDLGYRFHAIRDASGGVSKLTVVFASGQMDLIIVPRTLMRLARLGMQLGIHQRHRRLKMALNEIHTCLRSGYRFLKGEPIWGSFYAKVSTEMEGVRLDDVSLKALADVSVVDLLWVWQKLARGELCAAQHVLHYSLGATNFRLQRELILRRGESLPSFGLGRRVETLLDDEELARVRINARSEAEELRSATVQARSGLGALMKELVPEWRMPPLPELDSLRESDS